MYCFHLPKRSCLYVWNVVKNSRNFIVRTILNIGNFLANVIKPNKKIGRHCDCFVVHLNNKYRHWKCAHTHIPIYRRPMCCYLFRHKFCMYTLGFLSFSMLFLRFDIASTSPFSAFLIQLFKITTQNIQIKFWRSPPHRKKTIKINYCHREQWKMNRLPNASMHNGRCNHIIHLGGRSIIAYK